MENILENLNEVSISLDEKTITLARQAFDNQISTHMEELLSQLAGL